MDNQQTVSVLIPMYQAEKYIEETIRSILSQSIPAEIIVVDDGSADGSLAAARRCAEGNPQITVISMPHRGQAAARNTALSYAHGDYILYVDADDTLTENALEILMAGFEEEPEAGVICAKCRDFISPDLTEEEASVLKINPEPYYRMLSGCTLVRKEVYDLVGGFDESLPSSETAQWMLRMQDAGFRVHNTDYVTLMRRYHNTNFGRVSRRTQLQSYMEIIKQRRKKDA